MGLDAAENEPCMAVNSSYYVSIAIFVNTVFIISHLLRVPNKYLESQTKHEVKAYNYWIVIHLI